jgi:hypothetical protein
VTATHAFALVAAGLTAAENEGDCDEICDLLDEFASHAGPPIGAFDRLFPPGGDILLRPSGRSTVLHDLFFSLPTDESRRGLSPSELYSISDSRTSL